VNALPVYRTIKVSDGSDLRVAYLPSAKPLTDRTLLLMGGWGVPFTSEDSLITELTTFINVLLVETREKNHSVLAPNTVHDLDRMSDDVREIVEALKIQAADLVLYGYSWGAVIAAHSVTSGKVRPYLTVLASPIEHLIVPPLTRYLIPVAPITLFLALRPLLELWIRHLKTGDAKQDIPAISVLRSAHLPNWKAVSRSNLSRSFLSSYSRVQGPVLLIFKFGDRFHDESEYRNIAGQLPHAAKMEIPSDATDAPPRIAMAIREALQT
jgi:pimeloyl-ACP methyl ester carboxylesterase